MHLRVQIRRGEAVAVNCLKLLDRTAVGFKRQVEHSPAFAAYTLNRSAEQTLGVEVKDEGSDGNSRKPISAPVTEMVEARG